MANILGLRGYNKSDGTDKLIAAYGNDLVDVDTGTGYGLNVSSSNNSEFEVFLDSLFWQNYNHTPVTFDGTSWTRDHVSKVPIAKYLKVYGTRLYLGNIKIGNTAYPSRVWYSDLPKNDTIQWGYEQGSNGVTEANGNQLRSANAGFKTYNIKSGDPLIITSGSNAGEYTVESVPDDQRLLITGTFSAGGSGQSYWVGGNWFDVRTDNNDVLTWIGENNDRLLAFKQDSLHRYDRTSLRTVKGVPGTSSGRSVVNIRGATIYFHGSTEEKTGFYMYDGRTSVRTSNAIQPFIDGIASGSYSSVVSWREGDVYRAYVGTVTNSNENISLSKCVMSYDMVTNSWSTDPIADTVTASTTFRESGAEKVFIGTSDDEVHQVASGNSFNTAAIPWKWETNVIYPRGQHTMNVFTRTSVVARDAGGVNVSYRLWDKPFQVDDNWTPLGDIKSDRTEFLIPQENNNAMGIQYRFEEMSTSEPTPKVESVASYSYPERTVIPEIKSQS